MDDPKILGPQDRSRVNTDQDYEVRYWTQEFGVTEELYGKPYSAWAQAPPRCGSICEAARTSADSQ